MFVYAAKKKIHCIVKGKGAPVLFVHGWGGSSSSLIRVAEKIAKTRKVIIIDLPGFGKSDRPDQDWGVEEYAQIILKTCSAFKISKTDYFGHSFGGSLGIYLASTYPTYIEKLILCSSSYKRAIQKKIPAANLFHQIPVPGSIKLLIRRLIYRLFFPRSDSLKYPSLESNFRKIISQDLSSCLPKIQAPTLILWGDKDNETPLPLAYELEKKIKNSQLVLFKDKGHALPLVEPNGVFKEIDRFLL